MGPDAEAYRILRTNIKSTRKAWRKFADLCFRQRRGRKTTTLCNLAYICAQGVCHPDD